MTIPVKSLAVKFYLVVIMLDILFCITCSLSLLLYSCSFAGLKLVACLRLLGNIKIVSCINSSFFLFLSTWKRTDCFECSCINLPVYFAPTHVPPNKGEFIMRSVFLYNPHYTTSPICLSCLLIEVRIAF